MAVLTGEHSLVFFLFFSSGELPETGVGRGNAQCSTGSAGCNLGTGTDCDGNGESGDFGVEKLGQSSKKGRGGSEVETTERLST